MSAATITAGLAAPLLDPSPSTRASSVLVWNGPGGQAGGPGRWLWCPTCADEGAAPEWFPAGRHGSVLLMESLDRHLVPGHARGGAR